MIKTTRIFLFTLISLTPIFLFSQMDSFLNKNLKNGCYYEYFENGNIKTISYYKNNTIDGIYIELFENSQINILAQFHEGKKNGIYFWYLENGKLYAKINFINDIMVEEQYYYIETGKLQREEYYDCEGRNIVSYIYEIDGRVHQIFNKAYNGSIQDLNIQK